MSTRKAPSKASVASKLPRFVKKTAAEYHADLSAYGRSALWTFWESRRQFEGEHITKDAPPRSKTKRMDIGTLCHYGLLEPEKFPTQYAIFPADVLAKKEGKASADGAESTKAAEAFRLVNERAGKVVLKQHEFETVRQVVESVRYKLDSLGWLGVKSRREQAIYWNEPETGLPCKTLLDWLIVTAERAIVIDFKTSASADPKAFKYVCESHGYWLQDAHYSEGAGLVTRLPVEFWFVVAETSYPFRCSVNLLDEADRLTATDTRKKLMRDLAACLKSGDFSEPWEDKPNKLILRPSCFEQ